MCDRVYTWMLVGYGSEPRRIRQWGSRVIVDEHERLVLDTGSGE